MAYTVNIRQFWRPPFQYSLLLTATSAAKLLHLYSHLTSLPPLLFILYLPTFIALDILNAGVFWVVVQSSSHGPFSIPLTFFRAIFCLGILGASSSQITFFAETGTDIKWGAAGEFAHDLAGLKLLFSGSANAALVSIFIILVARLISNPLYRTVESIISKLVKSFTGYQIRLYTAQDGQARETQYYDSVASEEEGIGEFKDSSSDEDEDITPKESGMGRYSGWILRMKFLVPATIVTILLIVRPRHFPFAHMSASLPYALKDIWTSKSEAMCQGGSLGNQAPFPLQELVSPIFWEEPSGRFPGWKPLLNSSDLSQKEAQLPPRPVWLPAEYLQGFDRWYNLSIDAMIKEHGTDDMPSVKYDPITDPLRISNLDRDLLGPLKELLVGNSVPIKHVVILSLESTRKDVFPLKKGSHLHDAIMQSHDTEFVQNLEEELFKLSANAEILTGEASGFESTQNATSAYAGTWRGISKDKGGLNVQGAFTGSTSTFKSMLGSHCGVQPLPVDFTVEALTPIYQPCIPSILNLFNRNKAAGTEGKDAKLFQNSKWKSVFVQSITDQFDHQEMLNQRMGFSEVVVKSTLLNQTSKYYPPTERESNYFGFPEPQVKPYIRDLLLQAKNTDERLFLSHFTSSTHHPWNTPELAGPTFDFLKRGRWSSEHPFNKYLNTIKYADGWIGEMMDMLDEVGLTEETLVVMVGDHGYAFDEDHSPHTTFENGHISNIRVPLLFHHPLLPKIQLNINATSLSILPTILDLLISTSSLDTQDQEIAEDLIQQYEGQSLARPFQAAKNGRQAWNIAVLNAGGAVLAVSSAAVPYRLVLPICSSGTYRFTDTARDPYELAPIEAYSIKELEVKIRTNYEKEVGQWVLDAEKVGKWWVSEQRRRWGYRGAARMEDRRADEMRGAGSIKKEHWWDT